MRKNSMYISNASRLFFTADPHFFDRSALKDCKRPFADVNDMTEGLIRNWNEKVPEDGQTFVLGDMFWSCGDAEHCKEIMERLNGRKWLVTGDQDRYSAEIFRAIGFEDVFDYLELTLFEHKLICFHYPIIQWNGFHHGSWHLHGHFHGQGSHFSHRAMDVGVDCNGYTPVAWREIGCRLHGGFERDGELVRDKEALRRKIGDFV